MPYAGHAAPTFVVDNPIDAAPNDASDLEDGVCETAPGNGVCTLRAAVMEANEVDGGGATIRLPPGVYFLMIAPTITPGPKNGDLDLLAPMTIVGDGPSATIIDANELDRVIVTDADAVTLRGLTIQHGRRLDSFGGGIQNEGSLTLENVVVFDNDALAAAGIASTGTLVLRDCIVWDNEASQIGGGIVATGRGSAHIADSWIRENRAGTSGGGIANAVEMRVERTLIDGNSAEETGGGILNIFGTLLVVNSTVWQNGAVLRGGGVYAGGGAGSVQLLHTTITENLQFDRFGPVLGGGLAVEPGASSLLLRNSVVAGNQAQRDGAPDVPSECGSADAPILSGDYNLIANRASCFLNGALAHVNASDVDPQLLGPTPSGGFAADQRGIGPTVEAIPAASCTDELGAPMREDQRGYARTGDCDIGAHESGALRAPDPLLGVELIRNGGAAGHELGPATDGTGVAFPPYWRRDDDREMTQIVYGAPGGYPLASEAPPGSGVQFFGGGINSQTIAVQEIDVSALAARIDAGEITYRLAGAFGGYFIDDDAAMLAVFFEGDSGALGNVLIGGYTSADRGGDTGLLPDSAQGTLPPGTRSLDVILEAIRANGESNDGYSDDLSLVLPEPAGDALAALAVVAVLGLRARRKEAAA
jgi:hypothetical protein